MQAGNIRIDARIPSVPHTMRRPARISIIPDRPIVDSASSRRHLII